MNGSPSDKLSGMFFTLDDTEGNYSTGQVVGVAAEGVYFIRFDGADMPLPLELVSLAEMLHTTNNEQKLWRFFATVEERDRWLEWLDASSTPRVLSLVRPASPDRE
ncbi:hypothetical protein [Pararhizobium arenae]|uniref:hypothetical protein n=1 Tax=Pararhizobium arenae TaxID=1856850 RepID=UPI00094B406B|nr:hypothetical protein [Pararhizobium arenae]